MTTVVKDPLMYFRPNSGDAYRNFLQLRLTCPSMINRLTKLLEKADEVPGLDTLFTAGKLYDTQVYEANISHELRFMVDSGLVGGGWCTLRAGKYRVIERKAKNGSEYYRTSIGVTCAFEDVLARNHGEMEWAGVPEHRILAVSVTEVLHDSGSTESSVANFSKTSKSSKPSSSKSSPAKPPAKSKSRTSTTPNDEPTHFIAAISVLLTSNHTSLSPSSTDTTILFCHTHRDFTLSHPSHGSRTQISRHADEKSMILAFREMFLEYDPDVVTGFEVAEQFGTILSRAAALGVPFARLGRIPHLDSKIGRKQIYRADWVRSQRRMSSTSNREFGVLEMAGRVVLDSRQVVEREERLRSYTLADCVMAVLGTTKETLDIATVTSLYRSNTAGRKRLLDYAERELDCAMNLVRRGASYVTYLELARVTGLNIGDTFQRGQMIRFWSQLFRYCHSHSIAIPTQKGRNESQMVEGSLVMAPEAGYETTSPVAVLDFRSLYPSIILAHNLCYSTLLKPADRAQLDPLEYEAGMAPEECYFVKSGVKKGVVPSILELFLEERKKVRKKMAETADPVMRTILNGRQLALKVSANAIYGAVGSRESPLQCLPIAETTIKRGATMLQESKEEIERSCTVENGFAVDAKVVYGDTDSLFVKLPGISVHEAFKLGKEIAERISRIFPDPIALEFQSVFFPSLLINRKRYCAMEWTAPEKPDGVTAKGIESQRRDSSPILINMMNKVVDILMPRTFDNGPNGKISAVGRARMIGNAVDYTKWAIRRMLEGRNHAGEFVLTKGLWLGTESGDYKAKQPHVELVERMRKREPWREFKDGERIPFVYVAGAADAKGFEKSEDPAYALRNELPLDYSYYLGHQIEGPLERILELLLPASEVQSLFHGDHTKVVARSTGGTRKGSIASFFNKQADGGGNCIWCRRVVKGEPLCEDCKPSAPTIYSSLAADLAHAGTEAAYLHAVCGQCQRSRMNDVLCVNEDCEIFFRRLKNGGELERAAGDFERVQGMLDW